MAKRLTDTQRQALKASKHDIDKEVSWLYEKALEARKLYKDEKEIEKFFKKINKEIDERGMTTAYEPVKVLGWTDKEKFKDERNRYISLTNLMGITNGYGADEVHDLFLVALKRFLLEDFEHPMDALMSKKEQRSAKKRRKIEKKHGKKNEVKEAKSDEQKKIDSRIRKLKREAKKEGISLDEYKTKYGYGDDGKKIKKNS